jgi:hypothetical protein
MSESHGHSQFAAQQGEHGLVQSRVVVDGIVEVTIEGLPQEHLCASTQHHREYVAVMFLRTSPIVKRMYHKWISEVWLDYESCHVSESVCHPTSLGTSSETTLPNKAFMDYWDFSNECDERGQHNLAAWLREVHVMSSHSPLTHATVRSMPFRNVVFVCPPTVATTFLSGRVRLRYRRTTTCQHA